MKDEDVNKVKSIIKEEFDSFWVNNEGLFDEILQMMNNAGYDLKLFKGKMKDGEGKTIKNHVVVLNDSDIEMLNIGDGQDIESVIDVIVKQLKNTGKAEH